MKVSRWVTKSVLGALSCKRKNRELLWMPDGFEDSKCTFLVERDWDDDNINNDDHYDDLVCLHTVLSKLLLIHMNLHTVVASLKRSSCPSLLDPLPRASSQVTSFVGKKKEKTPKQGSSLYRDGIRLGNTRTIDHPSRRMWSLLALGCFWCFFQSFPCFFGPPQLWRNCAGVFVSCFFGQISLSSPVLVMGDPATIGRRNNL